MKENDLSEEDVQKGSKGKIFGWSFILTLIMAANLAMFLNDRSVSGQGWTAGRIARTIG